MKQSERIMALSERYRNNTKQLKANPVTPHYKPAFNPSTRDPWRNLFISKNHGDPIFNPLRDLAGDIMNDGIRVGDTYICELTQHLTAVYAHINDENYITIYDTLEGRVYFTNWYKNRGSTPVLTDNTAGGRRPMSLGGLLSFYDAINTEFDDFM